MVSFLKNKNSAGLFLLTLIILFAVWSRKNVFWLPHVSADETHFVGLALKLDSLGIDGYNIRGLDYAENSPDGIITLTEFNLSPGRDPGMMVEDMYRVGRGYYDKPLYHNTPGFPYLLMLSHRLFSPGKAYAVSSTYFEGQPVKKNATIREVQFFATIWPFVFGILLVVMTYFFGKMLFNSTTGLIASFLVATNPVSIFVSQKVWGDQISGVFVLLSAMLIYKGYRSGSFLWGGLAGVSAGLAYLLKETAGFFVIGFVMFFIYENRKALLRPGEQFRALLNPFALAMGLGFLAVTAMWFLKVYEVYGIIIHLSPGDAVASDAFSEFKQNRPPSLLFYLAGIAYLSPLFLASLAMFSKKLRHKAIPEKQWVFAFLFCWIIAYVIIIVFVFSGQEHRYMIHIYPALAVMAAFALNELRNWGAKYTKHWKWLGANELMVILLIIFARWGLHGAFEIINQGATLFPRPF